MDSLEAVMTVFFSNARHNARAAFLLCDSLVETTCRIRIKVGTPNLGRQNFHWHLNHAAVGLAPPGSVLGTKLVDSHNIRNELQHNTPALMVDVEHCADAILDLIACMEHCFPGTVAALPDRLRVLHRILKLYGRAGDQVKKREFQLGLTNYGWRGDRERARANEMIVQPGQRTNWSLIIPAEFPRLEAILNQIGANP
ncbi:MAG: hypothetical protein ACR2IE_09840 [Candidatus Sumerlaeaceae bacterium]